MAILIPSILSKQADEVHEKIQLLEAVPGLTTVHIDFADGKFVDNQLVSAKEIGRLDTRLELEAHLMVANPQTWFHDLEVLGYKTVFVHFEAFAGHEQVQNALYSIRHLNMRAGLAINPNTDIEVFDWFIGDVDELLLMGVTPGYQGQPLDENLFVRLSALRKKHKDVIIEVDGGVKLENFAMVAAEGADKLNVGSGIWHAKDPKHRIQEFLETLK